MKVGLKGSMAMTLMKGPLESSQAWGRGGPGSLGLAFHWKVWGAVTNTKGTETTLEAGLRCPGKMSFGLRNLHGGS